MGTLRNKLVAVSMLALGSWGTASAIPIVDTGPSPFLELSHPGTSLATYQFIAGRFTTTEDFAITSLSAFVRNYACCSVLSQQLSLGIASGPEVLSNSQLTNLITLPTTIDLASGAAGWASVTVDNFLLSAGTWWLVASVQLGQFAVGLGMPGGVPNPMDDYAYFSQETGVWNPLDERLGGTLIPGTYGFRVDGDQAATSVPTPGPLGLFVFGLMMLGMARRPLRV